MHCAGAVGLLIGIVVAACLCCRAHRRMRRPGKQPGRSQSSDSSLSNAAAFTKRGSAGSRPERYVLAECALAWLVLASRSLHRADRRLLHAHYCYQ